MPPRHSASYYKGHIYLSVQQARAGRTSSYVMALYLPSNRFVSLITAAVSSVAASELRDSILTQAVADFIRILMYHHS